MILLRKSILAIFFFCVLFSSALAQNVEKVFNEGKQLFDQKDYALALIKFAPLTSIEGDNELIPYASYYYAISAYNSGDKPAAKNMLLQMTQRFPNWTERQEVQYWLAQLNFESRNYQLAMGHLAEISNAAYVQDIDNLKYHHLSQITDLEQLKELLALYPEEAILANNLVNAILREDVQDQDIDLINQLSEQYQIAVNVGFEDIASSPKKDVYNVGLFLPFRYREDSAALENLQRTWPVRFYEGVQLGIEKLASEGINVNAVTYDTQGSGAVTKNLLDRSETKDLDLMIGPVFRGPVQEASSFTKENRINMVNPLSSTSGVIEGNAHAFLYYPSNESLALEAADYAKTHFSENKHAAIFYSGPADKPRADLYKNLIERDSFEVVIFQGVRSQESVKIQLLLTEEEELDKDSLVVEAMIAEMDSLREAEVDDWEIYNERDFVYDTLKILPDSIGHIFIASDDPALSASAISGIASRPDTIGFIGSSRWLAAEQSISFNLLENIDATFLGANLIDYNSEAVQDFRKRYQDRFHAYPKKDVRFGDAYNGYDIIVTFGRLMHQYGKYFQIGLKRKSNIEGELTESFDYKLTNDNRYIPILKIRNSQIEKRKD